MTILGVIADREHAWVWTDSEVYVRGEPAGMRPKLVSNVAATIVCVSCGWESFHSAAAAVVSLATDFDNLCDAMPDHLRRAAVKIAARWEPTGAAGFACQTILLVGFSKRHDRVLSYALRGCSFFEPELANRLSIPPVEIFDTLKPRSPAELLPGAREQMDGVRMSIPGASGGQLIVAHVRPDLIQAGPVAELTPSPIPDSAPQAPHLETATCPLSPASSVC